MSGISQLPCHTEAKGEYIEVELANHDDTARTLDRDEDTHGWRPSPTGWVVLWSASVLASFALGSSIHSPKQDAAAIEGIVSLASAKKQKSLNGVYQRHFKEAEHVDLTHSFSPKIPVWSGFHTAKVSNSVVGEDLTGFAQKGEEWSYLHHGFVATSYTLPTDQLGTQLDPPAHWNEYGATISDLPPTVAVRPLVVINIVPQVAEHAGYHATVDDVKTWEKKYGRVPQGSVVFVRSDWSKHWKEYENSGTMPSTFPGVELETLKFLHGDRNILFHGHEPLDTDMTPSLEGEAWLMHNDFAQAEGVTNLDRVPESGCLVSIGYAKALRGSGGYARFVAICPAGTTDGGSTIENSPGAPLPRQMHPLRRNDDGVLTPDPDAEDTPYCSLSTSLGCNGVNKPVWK